MPWKVFEDNGDYCVHKLNADGGKGEKVACHGPDKSKAEAQVRALYASKTNASHPLPLYINEARNVNIGDKEYLVVPGTPLRVTVMNDYIVPASEIARSVKGWNGTPITIHHPRMNDKSANVPDPDVAIIGRFYNAVWDAEQLRMAGEYWIEVHEAEKYTEGTAILNRIRAGEALETSTGYLAEDENRRGEYGGKTFNIIHHNILPDHIAILLNQVGACSLKDGCGVNVNAGAGCQCPYHNEPSLDQKLFRIRDAFRKTFDRSAGENAPEASSVWVREIYPAYVIVEADGKLYRVPYMESDGNLTFAPREQWQSVEMEYVEVNEAAYPEFKDGHLPVKMLVDYSVNKGNRTPEQLEALRTHIRTSGVTKPVIVMRKDDGSLKIEDGNHRVQIADEESIEQVPAVAVDEQLHPILLEALYAEQLNKKDQAHLNHSQDAGPVLRDNSRKELNMNFDKLQAYLARKGLNVVLNKDGDFAVEEEPQTNPANVLSDDDIAALKSLAGLAPKINAQNLDLLSRMPDIVKIADDHAAREKTEKDRLVAEMVLNQANPLTKDEMEAMPLPVLQKLHAQQGTIYAPLSGGEVTYFETSEVLTVPHPILNAMQAAAEVKDV